MKPDWIIEIDNKSLTHRPDLWGHVGMAREVAAITRGTVRDPVHMDVLPQSDGAITVDIADYVLCPRYSALVIENVRVAPSPFWLQARLENLGLNAINNIVDVTNFILLELPQPMHAFDADNCRQYDFRAASACGREFESSEWRDRMSSRPADLVIADGSGPIAIAGVIGGADTAISETTKRVVLRARTFRRRAYG